MASDEELMRAVQHGDLSAFEQIVLRHQAVAWNTACRFLNDPAEAEDVAQDAFLRVLDAAPRYQPTARFRTYLLQIVMRLCLDRVRKKRPLYTDTLPDAPASGASPSGGLLDRERNQMVRQALDKLSAQQRLALILRYDEELSYQEIAAVLQVTPKAVERLLARGRAALGALLSDQREELFNREGVFRRSSV
ncbi:MAG: sigma-70 family RNA polymerase sigma factor [Verrucomicrobia bacterium]|nr:sigma-70 family RNA polymerase sigma factor [Verrucomicrobiota bacterium]